MISRFLKVEKQSFFLLGPRGTGKSTLIKDAFPDGLVAEVISGLSEGEEVIMHPDDSIKEGTSVRPRG
ncbi:MAG: hypothetical protein HZA06_03690 [Nitrospirae bacterium]|nr:hypothetical protein [Nitrospirota bacterium]